MKSFFIIIALCVCSITLNGQNIISNLRIDGNDRHANAILSFSGSGQRMQEKINFKFTAVGLKSNTISDFSDFAFIVENDTLFFTNDTHGSGESEANYSSLLHFEAELSSINLLYPEGVEEIELVLINASDNSSDSNKRERRIEEKINNCELPEMIPQSEWRNGLNTPNYSRTFTTTRNMIVHHSAGSNNATNYTQVVRGIYIFHTQERNWSDIGYNYLIAPNGVLYAGRDPGEGAQDEVMGAHFCGSNSGTMGVCLLGNFEVQDATEEAYNTLKDLLTWKGFKDNLNADAQNPHPLNSNLGVIAGHRDGNGKSCSTLCPGQYVYNRLTSIRSAVDNSISICNNEGEEDEPVDEEEDDPVVELPVDEDSLVRFSIYPNPVGTNFELNVVIDQDDRKTLTNLYVFDAYGRKVKWEKLQYQSGQITMYLPKSLKSGMYFLYVVRENSSFHRKFVVQ